MPSFERNRPVSILNGAYDGVQAVAEPRLAIIFKPCRKQLVALPFLMRRPKVVTGRITWIDDRSDIM
jgi:hypothetical protein